MSIFGFTLVWVIFVAFVYHVLPVKVREYNNYSYSIENQRTSFFWAFIAFLPLIIAAGFRINIGDTGLYRKGFLALSETISTLPSYLETVDKDKGFAVFNVVLKTIIGNSDKLYFLIIALVQGICLVHVYRKYSEDFALTIFLFVASADYISWMINGMRQFIAVAILFASFGLIVRKKYIPAIIIVLLASTIHASALIMLPIIFVVQGKAWNSKTVFFIVAIIVSIFFVDKFTPFLEDALQNTQYDTVMTDEIWINDDGTSLIRTLVYSLPAIISFVCRKWIQRSDDPAINIATNFSIVAAGVYLFSSFTSGIYVGRLPIYCSLYSYITLPWMLNHCFYERDRKILKCIIFVAYSIYYYYQVVISWGFKLF